MVKRKAKTKKKAIIKKSKKILPVNRIEEKPKENFNLKKTRIRVIGVGGGGGSIISEISSRVGKATFVAANTDSQALKEAGRNVVRFQFGESITHGLGTGMDPVAGEAAAISEKEKIKQLFENQDLCIIVASLGGGTGSGAAPIFAKLAKNSGVLTYGIFTMPFKFEGEKKAQIAKEALDKLKPRLHAFSIIPNEKVFQIIEKETPLKQALSTINGRLSSSLEGLIEIIYEVGLINIDFADLKTVLQGQGRLSYLNTVEVPRKEGIVQEAIEKLLNSPLFSYGIKGAKSVLYNIAGEKGLTLSEVDQISKTISGLVNKDAKIIFGLSQNQKYKGVIKTTILATGCGTKVFSPEKKSVKKHSKPRRKKKTESKEKGPAKLLRKKTAKRKKTLKIKQRRMNFKKPKKTKIKVNVLQPVDEITKEEGIFAPGSEVKAEFRVRKNAIQVKKEAEKVEQDMLEKEKFWETPAFLRRKREV